MGQEIRDGGVSDSSASEVSSRCVGCSISATCLVIGRDRVRENLLCCVGCKAISMLSSYARLVTSRYALKVRTIGCFGVEDFDKSIFTMTVPFLGCPHCGMDPWRAKYL